MLQCHMALLVFLFVLRLHSAISEFSRDTDLGYWHDLQVPYYEPKDNNATVSCAIELFKGNLRPTNLFLVSKDGKSHLFVSQPDDKVDDLVSGSFRAAVEIVAKLGENYTCQLELADGRKDNRTIDVPVLDGTPVVWFESSKYPELEDIPFSSFYWLIYDARGEEPLNIDIRFSICDPEESDCKEVVSPNHNYERWPFNNTFTMDSLRRRYMTGHATQSGYYILQASNTKGTTTTYFHLKVADGKPKEWDIEAVMGDSNEHIKVAANKSVELSCPIASPDSKKSLIHWFKNDERIYPDRYLKGTEQGEKLMIPEVNTADYGQYKCSLDHIDKFNEVHSDKAYITLSQLEVSAANLAPSSCSLLLVLLLFLWFQVEATHS